MPKFAQIDFSKLPTLTGAVELSRSPGNGQVCRVQLLTDGDGIAMVQLRRVQQSYAEIRRVTLRMPQPDDMSLTAYYNGTKWLGKLRPITKKPRLFKAVTLPTWKYERKPLTAAHEQLRAVVRTTYHDEGAFLDWLKFKSPLELAVDALAELTEAQVHQILQNWTVTQ